MKLTIRKNDQPGIPFHPWIKILKVIKNHVFQAWDEKEKVEVKITDLGDAYQIEY